jgi:hypothetical protein
MTNNRCSDIQERLDLKYMVGSQFWGHKSKAREMDMSLRHYHKALSISLYL